MCITIKDYVGIPTHKSHSASQKNILLRIKIKRNKLRGLFQKLKGKHNVKLIIILINFLNFLFFNFVIGLESYTYSNKHTWREENVVTRVRTQNFI